MLPSMPILFTRDSQDAFGNKIEPSTSFFNQNWFEKPVIIKEPERPQPELVPSTSAENDAGKPDDKNKEQTSEEKSKENALETALVRSFYTKVQSKFSTHINLPSNKFVQFQSILKTFDPNKETPVELYKKIEDLFGESHKDLVEEFLLFLKPGQAAEVGRFMDYFMFAQLTGFIELLQTTFARKPTVLRKVLRAITTGINSGNSEDMKNRVLPHLRSNPRLTKMFKSLFPDERPPDSVYDTGTDIIGESFLTSDRDRGYDVWELEQVSESKRNIEPKEGRDTTYLHGRVFIQQGRMLRSARVTYPYSKEPYRVHSRRLAPNNPCHDSPPQSDDERASPKRQNKINSKIPTKKPKKQPKSPTKTPKDFNDNTNIINSPKTTKKQTAKAKTFNKKEEHKEIIKKDKKIDVKLHNKKDEAKNKQVNNNNKEIIKYTFTDINPVTNVNAVTIANAVTNVNTVTIANAETNANPITHVNIVTNVNPVTQANAVTNTNLVTHANVTNTITKSYVETTNDIETKINIESKINMETKITTNQDKNQVATATNGDKKPEAKASWTRDEDKTMLQVLKGEPGSEQIFIKISELLPHRSVNEIKERFCHVMSLLQQMAVGEVT